MPSFPNDKIPIRRLNHWSTVTELAEGGFEVCGCPVPGSTLNWRVDEEAGSPGVTYILITQPTFLMLVML